MRVGLPMSPLGRHRRHAPSSAASERSSGSDPWKVTTPDGRELGVLKRLVVNPKTYQITAAEIVLSQKTGHIVRVPWTLFKIRHNTLAIALPDLETSTGFPSFPVETHTSP